MATAIAFLVALPVPLVTTLLVLRFSSRPWVPLLVGLLFAVPAALAVLDCYFGPHSGDDVFVVPFVLGAGYAVGLSGLALLREGVLRWHSERDKGSPHAARATRGGRH